MVADAAIQITDVVGLSSFCYYAAAVAATAQAFSVAVDAVTMDAILSSGSFSFSAAADADSNITHKILRSVGYSDR